MSKISEILLVIGVLAIAVGTYINGLRRYEHAYGQVLVDTWSGELRYTQSNR